MSYNNELVQLNSLVKNAEENRNLQNTKSLQKYMDKHPQLSDITINMTGEIKNKLLFYISNADNNKQNEIQDELEQLTRHLENLSEKPTILYRLLYEEVLISYLMLRCSDVMYSRHHGSLTSMSLRRSDAAQTRFLRALKALANIQKIPQFLNVNLGTQQIAMTS